MHVVCCVLAEWLSVRISCVMYVQKLWCMQPRQSSADAAELLMSASGGRFRQHAAQASTTCKHR